MSEYVELNRSHWNSRVPHHVVGYGLERFRTDPDHLSDVVRFDLPWLGSIAGLDVVHLQCHIGTDTLSLARLGARSVTGLDFSPPALEAAATLARECDATIDYVESELYGAVGVLGSRSVRPRVYGHRCIVLAPRRASVGRGGVGTSASRWSTFFREGHPVLWSLSDPRPDGLLVIEYPYFETEGVHFSEEQSYIAHDEPLASPDLISFNHGIAEVITALMKAGMHLTAIEEHDTVPWNPLGSAMTDPGSGEYRLRDKPCPVACHIYAPGSQELSCPGTLGDQAFAIGGDEALVVRCLDHIFSTKLAPSFRCRVSGPFTVESQLKDLVSPLGVSNVVEDLKCVTKMRPKRDDVTVPQSFLESRFPLNPARIK